MFMSILVIFVYLIIIVLECTPLFKEKNTNKIILYMALSSLSMVVSSLLIMGVPLTGISDFLKNVVEKVFGKQ